MKVIRFRKLNRPVEISNGVEIRRWEIAFNEADLRRKLNGEVAEIIMPAKPFLVRMWRKMFPLRDTHIVRR